MGSAEGKIFLNGNEITDDAALSAGIRDAIAKTGNNTVIIEGDKMAFHGEMVKIMGIAKEAGAGSSKREEAAPTPPAGDADKGRG